MKNKKSSLFFLPGLVFITLIVLINLYIVLLSKNSPLQFPIGKRQFDLFETYLKEESTLFYIDQSAKYSLQQSIYDLAQNGGISDAEMTDAPAEEIISAAETKCGKVYGYSLWYELQKDDKGNYVKKSCIDEDKIKISLEYLFNKNLNQYLLSHPYNIPLDNYNYQIKNNLEIIGMAIAPLKFDILKDEAKEIIRQVAKTPQGLVDFTGTELCAKGAKCFLTEDAYKLLLDAQKKANEKGVSLEVASAYRTIEEQTMLWKRNPNSEKVCPPSSTCPHLTGNVVDVKLKEKTDWKLLQQIMSEAGWVRYAKEGWHFECCGTDRYKRAQAKGVTEIV